MTSIKRAEGKIREIWCWIVGYRWIMGEREQAHGDLNGRIFITSQKCSRCGAIRR